MELSAWIQLPNTEYLDGRGVRGVIAYVCAGASVAHKRESLHQFPQDGQRIPRGGNPQPLGGDEIGV